MKHIFETVISGGSYDLSSLLNKIDCYHVEGKLTDEEREDLHRKARGAARPENSVDVMAKLMELEKRIRKLESGTAVQPDEDYPEYVVGKWYYSGDKVSFGGKHYVCIAPSGVVCTWNPADYPTYWEAEG